LQKRVETNIRIREKKIHTGSSSSRKNTNFYNKMPSTIAQATPAHFTSPPSPSIYRLLLVKLSSSTTAIATKLRMNFFPYSLDVCEKKLFFYSNVIPFLCFVLQIATGNRNKFRLHFSYVL
jgi:hypothetical protein